METNEELFLNGGTTNRSSGRASWVPRLLGRGEDGLFRRPSASFGLCGAAAARQTLFAVLHRSPEDTAGTCTSHRNNEDVCFISPARVLPPSLPFGSELRESHELSGT